MQPEKQSPYTFIVRLWREKSEDSAFVWRGSVDCVQSGERSHFQSFDGLMDVIARLAGIPPGDGEACGKKTEIEEGDRRIDQAAIPPRSIPV